MWAVMALQDNVEVQLPGRVVSVPLTYYDGMIGVIPVFATRQEAEEFARDDYGIVEVRVITRGDDQT